MMPRILVLLLAMLCGACGEAGLPLPLNPGTVRVSVHDEQGGPVAAAGVRVEMPNNSGGVFEVGVSTKADGTTTITAVPAGSRRVTVTPPTGYSQGSDPLVRFVDVQDGKTVEVTFAVRKT